MYMQMVDVNSSAVTTNYSIMEIYSSVSTNTCGNGAPTPQTCITTGPTFCQGCTGGEFSDTMAVTTGTNFNYCSSINPTILAGNCGFSLTSTWSMCSSGLANNVWTSARVTGSKNITVNNTTRYTPGTNLF